jgi:hypothetical protein
MEYKAIECGTMEELNAEIAKMISDGWEPTGGVSIALSESDDYQYYAAAQAMVRKAN